MVIVINGQEVLVDPDVAATMGTGWFVKSIKNSSLRYVVRNIPKEGEPGKRTCQSLHRYILGLTDRSLHVDHIDGDGLNNCRDNLREVTRSVNMRNMAGAFNGNRPTSSPYLGVSFYRRNDLWNASIGHEGKHLNLGYYETQEEANRVRLLKEKELWGIEPRRRQAFIDAGLEV